MYQLGSHEWLINHMEELASWLVWFAYMKPVQGY